MDKEQLQAIKARRNAIGLAVPWKYEHAWNNNTYWIGDALDVSVVFTDGGVKKESDAIFIANAPTDIDALLSDVERLTAERDAIADEWQAENDKLNACRAERDNLYEERRVLAGQLEKARLQIEAREKYMNPHVLKALKEGRLYG
jgi:outer membrane murein-binding lipoprotein Lpp